MNNLKTNSFEIKDDIIFANELQKLLDISFEKIEKYDNEFKSLPFQGFLPDEASASKKTDNADKTMDLAEAFAFYCILREKNASSILELGTRFGCTAAFFKIVLSINANENGNENKNLVSCDLYKDFRYINEKDFTFLQGDARNLFPAILENGEFDCLFNDAHPYDLIKKSSVDAIDRKVPILAFHDVGKNHKRSGFDRERYFIPEEQKINCVYDSHGTPVEGGHWERHVMAELFSEKLLDDDFVETDEFIVQIFDSLFGLGIAIRK